MLSEKRLSDERKTQPQRETYNKYYLHVSGVYRAAKWGALLLFTLFLVLMLVLQRDNITYENFRYLLRDLNLSSSVDGAYASLVFDEFQRIQKRIGSLRFRWSASLRQCWHLCAYGLRFI